MASAGCFGRHEVVLGRLFCRFSNHGITAKRRPSTSAAAEALRVASWRARRIVDPV